MDFDKKTPFLTQRFISAVAASLLVAEPQRRLTEVDKMSESYHEIFDSQVCVWGDRKNVEHSCRTNVHVPSHVASRRPVWLRYIYSYVAAGPSVRRGLWDRPLAISPKGRLIFLSLTISDKISILALFGNSWLNHTRHLLSTTYSTLALAAWCVVSVSNFGSEGRAFEPPPGWNVLGICALYCCCLWLIVCT
jgi:hypothetical protein